ncbi:hypothetical protein EPA93_02315 [Ktedonosporobacter rubrisoli]|uniref:HTH luxR-type domain-containing protein n=1 Tax=Ktedonosporobacter rubrisoli TaxID=2509675 RepID=A0A4P6JIJ7_KTERU|nr:LuxR C-terminal-related transcriptional regulator [Ktedonosporobacter rubrisoli]QBD74888.1 hypothetical protein EPA93_02315 [Ktedonosporobacter rubrisoli]
MPKQVPAHLHWSEERQGYEVSVSAQAVFPVFSASQPDFQNWLHALVAFSFRSRSGAHCTFRKEAMRRGKEYWYGYRRVQGKLLKRYIGRSADLTLPRLEAIAEELANGGTSPAPSQRNALLSLPPTAEAQEVHSRTPDLSSTQASYQLPVLEARLHPPYLPASLIERPALLARLDAAPHSKLTLLVAPAGFGKTTLVSQWITTRHQGAFPAVAWVSLDVRDNDPMQFWRYLFTACQSSQAATGKASFTSPFSRGKYPLEGLMLETIVINWLNALAQQKDQQLLILDDYHVISTSLIHDSIAFALEHLPSTLHLILISRTQPPLPLARLRANAQLCEISSADLRFSLQETSNFLKLTGTIPPSQLSPALLQHIQKQLEGWAAGLRLLTLTLQEKHSQEEIEQALANLQGLHRPLQEYFVEEILLSQTEARQEFLLRTSILPRLCEPLCAAVTGQQNGEQLADLEKVGLFLERQEGSQTWYQYQALWASALREEAHRRLGVETIKLLFARASRWFEQAGYLTDAIEMALQGQDYAHAAQLIVQLIKPVSLASFSSAHTLYRWLEQLPADLLRLHPLLCLSYAFALTACSEDYQPLLAGTLPFEELLQLAEAGFQEAKNLARLGEAFALRSRIAFRQEEHEQAAASARQALVWLAEKEQMWRAIALDTLGKEMFWSGQLEHAQDAFLQACAHWEIVGDSGGTRGTLLQLGVVSFEQGALHLAAEYLQQALSMAKEQHDSFDTGHAYLGLAHVFYAWNDLDACRRALHEAGATGIQLHNIALQVEVELLELRTLQAQGKANEALPRFIALLARLRPAHEPLLYRKVLVSQARLQLALDNLSDTTFAPLAVQDYEPGKAFPQFLSEQEALLQIRILLRGGQIDEALSRLHILLKAALEAGRRRSAWEIHILMALAYARRKQVEDARHWLVEVLKQTRSEGYMRLFLDEGPVVASLLRSLIAHLREKLSLSYLQILLEAFASLPAEPGPPGLSPRSSQAGFLSPQELRVLRKLAAGLSNAEIARELVVSIHTIRSQVQSIYRKLNVDNRLAASNVARQLHLL